MKLGYVTQISNKVLNDNNLIHIRLHDLRHSCATILLANGISIKEIQELFGHSSYSSTTSREKSADLLVISLTKEKNSNNFIKTFENKQKNNIK